MKKVRLKKLNSLSGLQQLIGAVILLVIVCTAIYFVFILKNKPIPIPEPQQDTKVLLFKAEESDLESFTVHPSNGIEYTIINKDKVYVLQDNPDYQLNQSLIDEMVNSLIYLEVDDLQFAVEEDHLIDYSLNDEAIQVTARFSKNKSYTLRIGQRIPGDIPKDFGIFNDSSSLYALSVTLKNIFDQQMNWLHIVPEINFTPDLLDRVSFEGSKEKLVFQREAKDLWLLEAPFSYPAAEIKMKKMLSSISKMRFASFVETASEQNLPRYGLDDPRLTVTFSLAPSVITSVSSINGHAYSQNVDAQEIIIEIGDSIKGLGFYCLYLDTIYQASDLSMGFMLETKEADYLSQLPIDIPLNLINTLSIKGKEGKNHIFEVYLVEHILPNNDIAQDSQGDTLYDYVIVSENGSEVSAEEFIEIYNTLRSISANGTLNSFVSPVENSPLMQIEIDYMNEKRYIKFYTLDALHAAIEVDGHIVHYTDSDNLKKIEDQLSLLND